MSESAKKELMTRDQYRETARAVALARLHEHLGYPKLRAIDEVVADSIADALYQQREETEDAPPDLKSTSESD